MVLCTLVKFNLDTIKKHIMNKERLSKMLQLNLQICKLNDFNILIDFEIEAVNSFLDNSDKMIYKKECELRIKLEKWEKERSSYDNATEPFDMYV